jgi:hypothetical protein
MGSREILNHLEDVERHIAEGERCVATQRKIIERLQASHQDASHSIELLHEFEELQQHHLAQRARLLEQYGRTARSSLP